MQGNKHMCTGGEEGNIERRYADLRVRNSYIQLVGAVHLLHFSPAASSIPPDQEARTLSFKCACMCAHVSV